MILLFMIAVAWERHGQAIVLAGAAVGVLAAALRFIWPVVKYAVKFVKAVETQLLTNNGGSTLKDKIEAIDRRTLALEEWRVKQEGET